MTMRVTLTLAVCCLVVAAVPVPTFGGDDGGDEGWSVGKVLRDVGSGVRLFASDLGAVVTKPARMTRHDYIWLGELFFYGSWMFYYDEDIMRSVQQNQDQPFLSLVGDIGDTFQDLGLMSITNRYYVSGIVVGYVFGLDPLQRICTDILFSHWISGMYRSAFKVFVGRARPREGKGAYEFEFNSGTSLPSGHSSSIMQVATVFSHYADWWPATVALYTIALSVCYQRIESEEHWASDVWFGAMNGAAVARLVIRQHDRKGVIWVPTANPSTGTYGVQLQFNF
jgi:membrane-associated phospholipid phosphatase